MNHTQTTSAGLALQSATFEAVPLHIPDGEGNPYKTELTLLRTASRTIKINWWHKADTDRLPASLPHNHPWDFESTILKGGYTERRYTFDVGSATYAVSEHTYRAGDVNVLPKDVYHEVVAIEPGTVTRMVCGPARPGNAWSYLDPKTGWEIVANPDPDFRARLADNNRFMKRPTP